ncbi:MAG: triose-phosphate isomerase [Candidatus Parcubacteria bacterium]|nr:triose-phosphate isomerase [Candidatus Parcubacteria bacterium]
MSKIIIANWKMNLSVKEALSFLAKIKSSKNEVVLAAPYTFLGELAKHQRPDIKLGAQNVSQYEQGAFTGEISASMLKEQGCTYCLVGHSERRIYFLESDYMINQKIKNLLKLHITPVICIGENARDRKRGITKKILKKQLQIALKGIKNRVIIAYEPVWAISTFQKGRVKIAASTADIAEMHGYLRKLLSSMGKAGTKIIYGGTVNLLNSADIMSLKEVDGVLVGGASLKINNLNGIINNA